MWVAKKREDWVRCESWRTWKTYGRRVREVRLCSSVENEISIGLWCAKTKKNDGVCSRQIHEFFHRSTLNPISFFHFDVYSCVPLRLPAEKHDTRTTQAQNPFIKASLPNEARKRVVAYTHTYRDRWGGKAVKHTQSNNHCLIKRSSRHKTSRLDCQKAWSEEPGEGRKQGAVSAGSELS